MKTKLLLTSCYLLILTACSTNIDIEHVDEIEFNNKVVDFCTLITKIDDYTIKGYEREDYSINTENYEIICPKYQIQKLGKQDISIKINGTDRKVSFNVKDTTSPNIVIPSNYFDVEKDNKYFNLKSMIQIEDLYDKNPIIGYTGHYDLEKIGKYYVDINAKDNSGNESTKRITINVEEKEVKIIEKEVIITTPPTSTLPSISKPEQSKPPVSEPKPEPTLQIKSFLFSDGYDIQSGFSACQKYRGSQSGSCSPLIDDNNIAYGYIYNQ